MLRHGGFHGFLPPGGRHQGQATLGSMERCFKLLGDIIVIKHIDVVTHIPLPSLPHTIYKQNLGEGAGTCWNVPILTYCHPCNGLVIKFAAQGASLSGQL